MSIRKVSFFVWMCVALGGSMAHGQAARSPFSSYGLGEQYGTALAPDQGMGGVGISNPRYSYINNQNPALLVFNRLTSFQAGLIGEQRTQYSATQTVKSGSGNLNYLALSIPVMFNRWTSSISLMPYTRLNYQLKYTQPIEGDPINTAEVTESGSGGINQFSWSNGVSINRAISVGLRATYLFSSTSTEYMNFVKAPGQLLTITPNLYERTYISDIKFTPALSIHVDSLFKKNYRINFGVVYDLKANVNSRFYQRVERQNIAGIIDSLTLISNKPGTTTLPGSLSIGLSFAKSYRWIAAVDGSFTNYSAYRNQDGTNPYAKNGWRVAGGFEIVPEGGSLSSYLKRITYRTGVSLENYPYLASGNVVKDFGITFGVSLPVNRISSLDFAIKVGKKGDRTLNTIEENYFKFYFGLTFNDQWFIKRRFD